MQKEIKFTVIERILSAATSISFMCSLAFAVNAFVYKNMSLYVYCFICFAIGIFSLYELTRDDRMKEKERYLNGRNLINLT